MSALTNNVELHNLVDVDLQLLVCGLTSVSKSVDIRCNLEGERARGSLSSVQSRPCGVGDVTRCSADWDASPPPRDDGGRVAGTALASQSCLLPRLQLRRILSDDDVLRRV